MKHAVLALICGAGALMHGAVFSAEVPTGAKTVLNLWPGVAPGSETWTRKETITPFVFEGRTVPVTRNVVTPTLTVYLPEAGKSTGAAAVIAPGGAFRHVTMDSEGHDVARWLAARGIAGFVLKYRVVETPADDAGYKRALDELTAAIRDPKASPVRMRGEDSKYAVADGIQAHKIVRARAKEWGIDPGRIGMIGFSAGAALTTGVMLDPSAPKLAFAAPIYGGPIDPSAALPAKLPPVFLAVAQNDFVRANVLRFNDALQAGKHDSELHVFSSGGHGFGLIPQGTTSDHWIDELYWWLQVKGITK
jgi:acetyl esterase/lipase